MKIRWSGVYIMLIEAVAQGARKELGSSAHWYKRCTQNSRYHPSLGICHEELKTGLWSRSLNKIPLDSK